jgi:hypothetical protein
MWYKNFQISFPQPLLNRSPYGRCEKNQMLAKKLGIRYHPWEEIAPHWFANAGVSRPYEQFIQKPYALYKKMIELYENRDFALLLETENKVVEDARMAIKAIIGPSGRVIFDSNGSCVISTIAKMMRGNKNEFRSLTFSDQGRLVYAALGFEAKTVSKFRMNFEQPLALFEAPCVKMRIQAHPTLPSSVSIISIFHPDNTYRSDGHIMDEFVHHLKEDKNLSMVLLLHVSRTGRILPVEEMIHIARKIRPELSIFVDGCQAIGRLPFSAIAHIYELADGYIFVGHKAMGAMISGAAVVKPHIEEHFKFSIDCSLMHSLKLFQFESEEINERIIKRSEKSGQKYFFVSAPEILSMKMALEDSFKNYWSYQKIIAVYKDILTGFLSSQPKLQMNVHHCPTVDDILSFHAIPPSLGFELKSFLIERNPRIAIAPLTENMAVRIAIDPKLPNLESAVNWLVQSLAAFFASKSEAKKTEIFGKSPYPI